MQNKRIFSILLALFVAFGLWVYVVTVVNPEGEVTLNNIPVEFYGQDLLREDYNLIITEDNVASGVTLEFTGKRSELNKLRENKAEMVVTIDVTRLRSAREYSFSYDALDITLPASVSSQDFSLVGRSPTKVEITIGKLASKSVPVKVSTDEVQVVSGCLKGTPTQDYNEIIIEGPEEIINQVDRALVIMDRENVDQTITTTLPYILVDSGGEMIESAEISSATTQIEVTLPISVFKDVPLEVSLIAGGGASDENTVTKIDPLTIRLSGDPAVLDEIQSIKLTSIDLSGLMSNSETISRIISIPPGCTNISGEQTAAVLVQIRNSEIRQIQIPSTNFQFMNVGSTFTAEARTSRLTVSVRAPEDVIEQITVENLRVVVDFSGISTPDGIEYRSMPVKIYVDGFEGAGVIGSEDYSIMVDVIPIEEFSVEEPDVTEEN